MKKYLLLVLAVILFAVGCGKKDPIVGTWVYGDMDKMDKLAATFTFESDNKVTYENNVGITGTGTYEIRDGQITLDLDLWKKTYNYEIKDGKLSLNKIEHYDPEYKDMIKK